MREMDVSPLREAGWMVRVVGGPGHVYGVPEPYLSDWLCAVPPRSIGLVIDGPRRDYYRVVFPEVTGWIRRGHVEECR